MRRKQRKEKDGDERRGRKHKRKEGWLGEERRGGRK